MTLIKITLILVLLIPMVGKSQSSEKISFSLPDSVSLEFTFVAPGSFMMGSPEEEEGRDPDEGPVHRVEIEQGFYLGTYEVTQDQWLSIMHHNPAAFQHFPNHTSAAVESVSWNDCQVFIELLNEEITENGIFRLPTEEEWEYAARAGTQTRFYWGNGADWTAYKHAWANSKSHCKSNPVGLKPPNPWGFYDMAGNVWEWTATPYSPYQEKPSQDSLMVFRGGSWFDFPKSHRPANRHRHDKTKRYTTIGLRLVYEPYD